MKDDTVSRAAVMQSLTKEYNRRRTGDGLKLAWIEKAVNEVPAVQTCDDAVSRQQAIDALSTPHGILYPIRTVEELPSAQPTVHPQRTCVNCGRTVNNGGWYADGRTRCPIEEHYALPKDGFCHLWEKRNVTDDDYPERRTDETD